MATYLNPKTMQIAELDSKRTSFTVAPYYEGPIDLTQFYEILLPKINISKVDAIKVDGDTVYVDVDGMVYKTTLRHETLGLVMGRVPDSFDYIGSVSGELNSVMSGFRNVQVKDNSLIVIEEARVFQVFIEHKIRKPVRVRTWLKTMQGEWYVGGHWLKVVRENEATYVITSDYDGRADRVDELFKDAQNLFDLDYIIDLVRDKGDFLLWYLGIKGDKVTQAYAKYDTVEAETVLEKGEPDIWLAVHRDALRFLGKTNAHIGGQGFIRKLPNGVYALGFIGDAGRSIVSATKVEDKYGFGF